MDIYEIAQVDFYGDLISVFKDDGGGPPLVSIDDVMLNLGLSFDDFEDTLFKDPRIPMLIVEGVPVVTLDVLNGFLYLIRSSEVSEIFQSSLLKYQLECTRVLRDYWLRGSAINLRESPELISSEFRDERNISRPALLDATVEYCRYNEGIDPHQIYDRALSTCYKIAGIKSLGEDEEFSGSVTKYLCWLETTYAKTLKHCIRWDKHPDDISEYVEDHVKEHARKVGHEWLSMADSIPGMLYD
jgi:hypothetical protein